MFFAVALVLRLTGAESVGSMDFVLFFMIFSLLLVSVLPLALAIYTVPIPGQAKWKNSFDL
ncbi:MAG: hypothetical protein F6K36_13345 [Symploca sp. SIO3C6]|nr:hypothetical protein [Symploca sp. SIO3C6]